MSARQVQVWFQNKRQRERKISRSLGLFSTPGLPDTPAATAAKVAAERRSTDGEGGAVASAEAIIGRDTPLLGALDDEPNSADSSGRIKFPQGVPITRAVSCPGANGPLTLNGMRDAPTSFDDTAIPLGLARSHSGAGAKDGAEGAGEPHRRGGGGGASCSGDATAADLGPLSSMPWLAGIQDAFPGNAKQAEMHCRAAVAAARAAMDGGSSGINNASLALMANMHLRLPILQSLMPSPSHSMDSTLPGHNFDPLRSLDGSLDFNVDDLTDDLGGQLEAELLGRGSPKLPEMHQTPRTADALLDQLDHRTGSIEPSPSRKPSGRPWLHHPAIKKRAVPRDAGPRSDNKKTGLPLQHSGVSGLLDGMNLATVPAPDAEPESADNLVFDSDGQPLTEAEASMQAAADEYVQVITSAAAPFQIVFASAAWMHLCEFESQSDVIGQTLDIVEGPPTQRNRSEMLMGSIRTGQPCSLNITHHTRTGKPFSHDVRLEPLRDSQGKLHCFQATSSNIIMLDADGVREASELVAKANAAAAHDTDTEDMNLSRTGSGLRINEMLDLFNDHAMGESARPLWHSKDVFPRPHAAQQGWVPATLRQLPMQPPADALAPRARRMHRNTR